MDFDEIWYERYAIWDQPKLVLIKFHAIGNNSVGVTRTFEVGATLAPLPKWSNAENCDGEKLISWFWRIYNFFRSALNKKEWFLEFRLSVCIDLYRGAPKVNTHFNAQNICLNNLSVYLRFDFENVGR
jgi:hypothetical protein